MFLPKIVQWEKYEWFMQIILLNGRTSCFVLLTTAAVTTALLYMHNVNGQFASELSHSSHSLT